MRIWRDALTALVAGFAIADRPSRPAAPYGPSSASDDIV
jgi:hypothetical protein